MRDFKGMKRQRGRNRGGGGGQGGGKPQNANRAFDSNGPDNIKVRGHAQHVFEKYQQLARDAASSGDRVLAENFLQHAEHYFRVLRTLQPNRPVSDFIARETFASGYDIDFEDESGAQAIPEEAPVAEGQGEAQPGEGGEQPRENRQWENRGERQRDDRGAREDRGERRDRDRNYRDRDRGYRNEGEGGEAREDRPRDDRPREDRGPREDRPYREDRQFRDRDRNYRDDRGPREDRPRDDRPREDRGERRERSFDRGGERADPLAVVEPQAQPLTPQPLTPEPAEERAVLRHDDGEASHTPAFLQAAPTASPAAGEEAAPKRRPRARKPKEEAPAEEV